MDTSQPYSVNFVSNETVNTATQFYYLFPAIILSWILIDLWLRVIDVYYFEYFNFDDKHHTHVLILAVFFTIILFVYIYVVNQKPYNTTSTTVAVSTTPDAATQVEQTMTIGTPTVL